MPDEVNDVSEAATSAATEIAPVERAEGAPEVTPASNGDQAESTPPADSTDDFEEFKADVAKATGKETAEPEAETPAEETKPEKTDDAGEAPADEKASDDLLKQSDPKAGEAPTKLTDRPEWQAITKIADKAGKEEGKQARAVLRELYKREYDLTQAVEQAKPAQQVVQEMFQSVGGSQQGFNNMRNLIVSFDRDPANAVPMLKTLLADAEKRAGLVLVAPELVSEAQQIDRQVQDGTLDAAAAAKRKNELLELQRGKTELQRTQQQQQSAREREQRTQAEQQQQRAVAEIESAANAWEQDKLKNDPDYLPLKGLHTSRVFTLAESKVAELGRMLTAAEAKAIADEALKQVKAEVGKLLPPKQPKRVVQGGSNGSSGNNRQQPASEFEEYQADVQAALKRHGR
jgi:hypothetical protein